jgi:hypothetical protein
MNTDSHRGPDKDLRDLAENKAKFERFFERLHFEYWQEPTTDSVRKVCWLFRFSALELPDNNNPDEPTAPFLLVVSVDYELFISDAPDVPTSDNFDYCFNGVRLELRDTRTDETVGTSPLSITTTTGLKTFLSNFPSRPYSRRHYLPV